MQIFKPVKGCRIYASPQHMTKPEGEFIGWCEKVDGNICLFKTPGSPEFDRLIWQFSKGRNTWHNFVA